MPSVPTIDSNKVPTYFSINKQRYTIFEIFFICYVFSRQSEKIYMKNIQKIKIWNLMVY